MSEEDLSREEQERLYREREAARNGAEDCPPEEMALTPDVPPPPPEEKCDEPEEQPEEVFNQANPAPGVPAAAEILPAPLEVYNREISVSCAVGQVVLAGTEPSVVAAGEEAQEVYLDEVEEITKNELFRLEPYVSALQAHINADLIAAIDAVDFTAFDAEIVNITNVSPAIAALIRADLVTAQARADEIATNIANAGLTCGWENQQLWVTCLDVNPGYTIHYSDPAVSDQATMPAGEFTSEVSQADADEQAARAAAFELDCLVGNDEQTVTCIDLAIGIDETTLITWPVNWSKAADADEAAKGNEVVTLEDQGAGTWVVTDWEDFENNTESIALNALNGQEFMQLSQVGSDERRTLRTRVIIEADDPRAAAIDKATANEIAQNIALAELDCFFPNRPRLISCVTPTYGSTEVAQRLAGLSLTDTDADRATLHAELLGGDPVTYGGPERDRTNVGITDYGLATEEIDTDLAFETYLWPGLFDEGNEATAELSASSFAAAYLACTWISPQHDCQCVSTQADADQTYTTGPLDSSSAFSTDDVGDEGALFDSAKSEDNNQLPRGLIEEVQYPNRVADPTYAEVEMRWPDLPDICQAGLQCYFTACKLACCEPKPDDREKKVNGMPNFASWGSNWLSGPATYSDQVAFITAWNSQRLAADIVACDLGSPGPFDKADYDECDIPTPPVAGNANSPVSDGPITYGTPARFKYGGVLRWGSEWEEPSNTDEDNPDQGSDPSLLIPGKVKGCHKGGVGDVQTPDAWGLFHCAEGYAESNTPIGLGALARANAISRLDCTHIAWPRHLVNCPQPNQKSFGPTFNSNMVIEATSTREANEISESMILASLECRDTHNFMMTFGGGGAGGAGKLNLPAPAIANVGSDECIPQGLNEATLYESDCVTEAATTLLEADESSHIFIEAKCCEGVGNKRLILHLIPDPAIDSEIRDQDKQLGELGLASGRAALETLRTSGSEIWYIGSFYVGNLGLGAGAAEADRITVQAYSGPIILTETCCDSSSSSSSSSGSSEASSASSAPSSAGSDKSTAIVGMPWHEKGFGALFTMESNEVLFEFSVDDIELTDWRTVVEIDHRFLYVCEFGSLKVLGAPNLDKPLQASAHVAKHYLIIDVARPSWWKRSFAKHGPKKAHVKLTGVRRGFRGMDMPERSQAQFEANEEWLNSAYPAE